MGRAADPRPHSGKIEITGGLEIIAGKLRLLSTPVIYPAVELLSRVGWNAGGPYAVRGRRVGPSGPADIVRLTNAHYFVLGPDRRRILASCSEMYLGSYSMLGDLMRGDTTQQGQTMDVVVMRFSPADDGKGVSVQRASVGGWAQLLFGSTPQQARSGVSQGRSG